MATKSEILADLVKAVENKNDDVDQLDEITLKGLAKAALVTGAAAYLYKKLSSKQPSPFSRPVSSLEYSKALVQAKTPQEAVSAVVGLINIASHVLLSVPELRDLGYRLHKVIQDQRLEDFITGE